MSRARLARRCALLAAWLCLPLPLGAIALGDTPNVTITADQPLRFGTLLVPASGTRTVGPDGSVLDSGLFGIDGDPVGPAQFTVTYDRGNNGNQYGRAGNGNITIVVQVIFAGYQTVRSGGVTGQLSDLTSDLQGSGNQLTGSVATLTLANCMTRTCSQTFRIGARLDVTRAAGGGQLVFPLPATAAVIQVY
ncbi:MAG: DUF4402 domain-containing protein [Sphingomonadales bacterium]|nr:DUF4402 domain-containing protein [Sphingomonadales bacterium]MDE2568437.1 DUF4402 domain-containing protein [Sphingomonadales bacterium]